MNDLKVWLSYVSYPVTTAAYFERALRKKSSTVTVGPSLPTDLVQKWQLEDMKLPIKPQNIITSFTPNMKELAESAEAEDLPDVYLWVESVGGHFPQNLEALKCPKACYLIDSHLNLAWHLQWAKNFDYVFIAQREYLPAFRDLRINAFWLPLGCDPEVHDKLSDQKVHDVGFVGSTVFNPRREQLLKHLEGHFDLYRQRCFWHDMAQLFSQSRLVFNNAVRNDLNMRVFEAMSCGSLLVTDMARNSGQNELFADGEDYAVYQDETIHETVEFYLENDELREQIATRGRQLVHNAHTYHHRIEDLLSVVLNLKATTFTAEELRVRSLAGVADQYEANKSAYRHISRQGRSFVIPVLDYSPASEFNICGLLHDLQDIEGDVIIIFNSEEVAEQLKGHPRITDYAIMKNNIGVARAWNLGINIAATPTVFIVNADVHLEKEAVEALETGLNSLEKAACVGPQGAFVDYTYTRDFLYLDKGASPQPVEVDSVSGFLFVVKREYFEEKLLKFENSLTPCYFEEWDLGLQIKRAGLKSYVVPTTAYDHHWSGSIAALREISYYDRAEPARVIQMRNRVIFLNKWRHIAATDNNPLLLSSKWRSYGRQFGRELLVQGNYEDAELVFNTMVKQFDDDAELIAYAGVVAFRRNNVAKATELFKQLHEMEPEFNVPDFISGLQ